MTILTVNNNLISEIVSWTVPFLFGLFSSLIIDNLRDFRKKRRNKKFILYYLKNTILPVLPELESSYVKIKNIITNYERGFFTLPAFEAFNTNVLNGIKPVDYYEIFNEKYVLVNEINTMIGYLSENLPGKINSDFYNYIDNHLERINEVGNKEHVKTCPDCQARQSEVLTVLDLRIKEIKLLKMQIDKAIK